MSQLIDFDSDQYIYIECKNWNSEIAEIEANPDMKSTRVHRYWFSMMLMLAGVLTFASNNYAQTKSGLSLSVILQSTSMSVNDFVSAAEVKGEALVIHEQKKTVQVSNAPAVAVGDLTKAEAISLSEFVAIASGNAKIKHVEAVAAISTQEKSPVAVTSGKTAVVSLPTKPEFTVSPRNDLITTETVEIVQGANGKYKVTPARLSVSSVGSFISVKITGTLPADLAVFVRDNKIAEYSKTGLSIDVKRPGATELYVVAGGKMNIIPLVVKDASSPFDLKVPDSLLSLDGIVHGGSTSALYPGIENARNAPANEQTKSLEDVRLGLEDADGSESVPSLFYNERATAQYHTVKLKIVDDRTPLDAEADRSFPAAGVNVQVVGTNYVTKTNASGLAEIIEAPLNARLLVKITDQLGVYRPSVAEISTGSEIQTIRLMRNFSFDGFAEIAQSSQHAALGSFCLRLIDDATNQPIAGYRLEADARAEGPFYFNAYGFIDTAMTATGTDGRVCAFNVDPGPTALSLFDGADLIATLTKPIFSGYHLEDRLEIGAEALIKIKLASLAPAAVQLNAQVETANRYLPVEYAEVIPFGFSDPMTFVSPGLLESREPLPVGSVSIRLAAQSADFEPAIYSIPAKSKQIPIIPLVPRGFIEDMAVFAQVTYEPSLGRVFAEYNHHNSVDGESITLKLVDLNNNSRGEGWYFSDRPLTKAIFFNVPAGIYQIQVETADGYWLTSQVVYVYDENMTYVRLGGSIKSN